jgi:DNA modification methylase
VQNPPYTLNCGDCRALLGQVADNSVDAIVTDPPYELGFMNRGWDASGIAYDPTLWQECLRVLKPGGHMVAFGATRTYHRMAVAIEDAGFEIRDSLLWLYGSGFPKSHNISKAIDKAAGAERPVIGKAAHSQPAKCGHFGGLTDDHVQTDGSRYTPDVTAPATAAAQEWEGWGTALKPAYEPIVLARKPFNTTIASNVLTFRTGGLNVEGCRVGDESVTRGGGGPSWTFTGLGAGKVNRSTHEGRWPANVVLDPEAAALLEEQAPGACRFFYSAKASTKEREAGCETLAAVRRSDGRKKERHVPNLRTTVRRNHHPTVKPIALMRHLVRLVTPPGGLVLDPFCGSGTTGIAATLEGFRFLGCELAPDYAAIARARIDHWLGTGEKALAA